MQLSNEDIKEFAALWKEEFGEDISADDARRYATQLLELYTLLAEPLPSEAVRTKPTPAVPP